MEYQPLEEAARRLGITIKAMDQRVRRGTVKGAKKMYRWQGDWLRYLWHVPASYRSKNAV